MKSERLKFTFGIVITIAASVVITVFLLTLTFVGSAVKSQNLGEYRSFIVLLSENLNFKDGEYVLDDEYYKYLDDYDRFAMLIDENGGVVWEHSLPDDIPKNYSIQDIASMSRWYINDYPVYIRTRNDGIFVIGLPKDSLWKYELIFPIEQIEIIVSSIIPLILLDITVILLLGMRFYKKSVRKKEAARTEWIAGISHDIRTPLTMVMGCADEIYSENGDERADTILKNGKRITSLVADMNLVNKLQYGMLPLEKEKLRAAALIRSAAAEALNSTPADSHEIEIGELDENIFIDGDRNLLTRALVNIIRNSIIHNPYGCKISIELRKNILWAAITIKDDGSGYPASVINGIRESNGIHGLGLMIAEKTIISHGGKIKFFNNKGACTEIKLKARP